MNKNKHTIIEDWKMVRYRMNEEGFDYCWRKYSSFQDIKDEKFHELRKSYIEIANALEKYVIEKTKELEDE